MIRISLYFDFLEKLAFHFAFLQLAAVNDLNGHSKSRGLLLGEVDVPEPTFPEFPTQIKIFYCQGFLLGLLAYLADGFLDFIIVVQSDIPRRFGR